jgi:hypothetical protein
MFDSSIRENAMACQENTSPGVGDLGGGKKGLEFLILSKR